VQKGGEATLESSDGGPCLGSYQEEDFRQADDDEGPRQLTSCFAALPIYTKKEDAKNHEQHYKNESRRYFIKSC
jgi:hypothetical protein